MNPIYSIKEAINKMEHCAYQERCHTEVEQKLRSLKWILKKLVWLYLILSTISLMKADLPVVLPEGNTELRIGKSKNRK
jgi:hypothetical protein